MLLKRDVVEALTGMTLDQAKEIAENNPLGMDEVFLQMRDKVLRPVRGLLRPGDR